MKRISGTLAACALALLVVGLVLWAPLGALAGANIGWRQTGGPQDARIEALVVDPFDARVLYVGTPNGVYKSVDAGQKWEHLSQGPLGCKPISRLAIDPVDDKVVYAGGSRGLFRTTDGGATWTEIDDGLTSDAILALITHPLQSAWVLVGVERLVFQSTDRGDHWVPLGQSLLSPNSEITSLAILPGEADLIYVGSDQGLYKLADGQTSWQGIDPSLPAGERIEVIAPDLDQPAHLYLGTSRGLYYSADSGVTWASMGLTGQSSPVTVVMFDPQAGNTLYANLEPQTLFKSVDGGVTWASLGLPDNGGPLLASLVIPEEPRRFYLGTGRGVYTSTDGGVTWASHVQGIAGSEIRQLVDVPGTRGALFAATSWGIYATHNGGVAWEEKSQGLLNRNILTLALDPGEPSHLYAGTWQGEFYRSTDSGATWTLGQGPLADSGLFTGLVVCRAPVGELVPVILYAGTEGAGILRSLDLGGSWERIGAGLPDAHIGAIWASAGEEPSVYVGVGKGVYRLKVSAERAESLSWERLTPQPLNGRITSGLKEPGQKGHLHVATDAGGIYRGEADGTRWENLARGELPANLRVEALSIVARKRQAPLLCAITDGGIYCSQDDGQSWWLSNTDCMQEAGIRCLATDDRDPGIMYLGTAHGGVYGGRDISLNPPLWRYGVWLILLLAAAVLGGVAWKSYGKSRGLRQRELIDQNWETWNQTITETLDLHNHVTPEMLNAIPAEARLIAMHRFMDTHKNLDLVFQENPPAIEPAKHLKLQSFSINWLSLIERLEKIDSAAPLTARLTEQLCELLGFAPLEFRTYNSLIGHMVKAPTVLLSIPPRFPIVFILKHDLQEQDVYNIRNLTSVLSGNSFFALMVVIDDDLARRERAKELKRLVHGSSDDFIILDYQALASLFLANDPVHRLIDLILDQVDLTMVSPYVDSGPVPENMFFGRDYELKAILRTIRDHSFTIVGGRKIGKTSVLNKVHRLLEQTSGFHSIYLDCQYIISHTEFFGALSTTSGIELGSTSPEVLRHFILRLRRQYAEGAIVLLLDEVDYLLTFDRHNQMHLFRMFRALSQEGLCRFVFCGERQLNAALHDPNSPLFNFSNTIRLSYLLERDALRIIQEPMAAMGVNFEDPEGMPKAIVALSSCHPNIIQKICKMLIARVNARGDRVIRATDLAVVRASDEFRDFLLEVTWGNATPLEKLITVLMAGVAEFELGEVRQALLAQGCTLAKGQVEAALDGLVLFSILQKQGSRYSFAARSFSTIMAESHLAEGLTEGFIEELKAGGSLAS